MMTKLEFSSEYVEKLNSYFSSGGAPPTFTIKEVGDGVYSAHLEMGELSQELKFTLDGTPTENERIMDAKKITKVCTFEDGVWTTTVSMEGCPDVVHVRKIEGDEMHVTDTCDDLEVNDVLVKV